MVKDQIFQIFENALKKLGLETQNLSINPPNNETFGDFSTNIAIRLAKSQKKNPVDLANEIISAIEKGTIIEEVEVMKPGFINLKLTKKCLLDYLANFLNENFDIPNYFLGENKKLIIEYAHPNTHKLFHIGHLRNITTGECICRIFEATRNKVIRVNYQGDVGLHIAKTLWAVPKLMQSYGDDKINSMSIRDKIALLGKAYVDGNLAYEKDEDTKKEIIEINKKIYDQEKSISSLYTLTRQWSLEYFDSKYKRVGTSFDKLYFESQMAKRSIEIIDRLVKEKILEHSEGAVILNGKKHGVHTRVFLNTHGYPTYEGKELPLAEKETSDFGELDKIIHIVTGEQSSFFQTTFKAEELMDENRYKNKQKHLVYGWVHLKGGKMSSRQGNVVEADWLLDEAKKQIQQNYKSQNQVAETLSIAAVKYSFLKNGLDSDVYFDIQDSITLQGDSGPYLIYTYVRCKSVLNKIDSGDNKNLKLPDNFIISGNELILLRAMAKFPEKIYSAAKNFAPNIICAYLYDLSQKYNLFYQKNPILKAENEDIKTLRISLTSAMANILKHGLYLLGIETVEKM